MEITPLLMAEISKMSNNSPDKVNFRQFGFCHWHFVESRDTDTQAYVLLGEEDTIIAFQGSSSLQDWVRDFTCNSKEVLIWEERWIEMHSGFLKAWKSIEKKIIEEIPEKKTNLYTTGHSLGGALAIVSAFHLTNLNYKVIMHAFASPRVGNQAMSDYFTAKKIKHTCYYRDGDPVFNLPPKSMGYHHIPNKMNLKGLPWWIRILLWGRKKSTYCHKLNGYIKQLKKIY